MFDTGSTTDIISNDFTCISSLPIYMLKTPTTMKLGCIGSRSKINFGSKTMIHFTSKISKNYLDIANINQYDGVLEIPYMTKHRITLDIPSKLIIIDGKECVKVLSLLQMSMVRENNHLSKPTSN